MRVTIDPPVDADLELAVRARRGEHSALSALYGRCAAAMFGAALRLLADRDDAEDLLHDLFISLPELLAHYKHRQPLDAWLRGVAVRAALTRLRSGRRRRTAAELATAADVGMVMPHDAWSAIDLERAIARLSDNERTVFVLRQIEATNTKKSLHR